MFNQNTDTAQDGKKDDESLIPAAVVQKKPGRPKKKILKTANDTVRGVIDKPHQDAHFMELIYDDPKVFKKIFGMFKGYYVDDIFLNFNKDMVYIASKDHTKKTFIKIVLDCNKLTEYYCKEPFKICIKREYLDKVFSTIEKNHNKVVIFSKEDTYQSAIEINLINNELSVHDNYIIDLSIQPHLCDKSLLERYSMFEKNKYLINFVVKSKSFKRFINDSSANGKILTIEKVGTDNLKFKMCFNNKINFVRTLINDEYYSLSSQLKAGEFFNINLELDYIKPFSNMNITDNVFVYVDKNKKAIFENIIGDRLCVITIYNDIINYVTNTTGFVDIDSQD